MRFAEASTKDISKNFALLGHNSPGTVLGLRLNSMSLNQKLETVVIQLSGSIIFVALGNPV